MSKTRLEKIDGIKEDIEQLRKRQRTLLKQHNAKERKDRNHRFCRRMGLFESLLPDTAALDDTQFKTFLEKTVANDFGRKTLANLAAQGGGTAAPKPAGSETGSDPAGAAKPPETERQAG